MFHRLSDQVLASPQISLEDLAQAKALGVDEFVVGAGIPTRDFDSHLRRWADAVASAR